MKPRCLKLLLLPVVLLLALAVAKPAEAHHPAACGPRVGFSFSVGGVYHPYPYPYARPYPYYYGYPYAVYPAYPVPVYPAYPAAYPAYPAPAYNAYSYPSYDSGYAW